MLYAFCARQWRVQVLFLPLRYTVAVLFEECLTGHLPSPVASVSA